MTRGRKAIRFLRRSLVLFTALSLVSVSVMLHVDAHVASAGASMVADPAEAGTADCILVPGALVYGNGRVSIMLADRLDTAFDLYIAGVSDRILVSGDHGNRGYDEVNAMRDYLIGKGVPSAHIFMDHAGFDTYDSIYRARDVFQVRTCVVATQRFHIVRALFIADELGLEACGVDAARRAYGNGAYDRIREVLARTKAFAECRWLHPEPTFLGPSIPIDGDGNVTAD